jgi:hypothetical protein
MPLLGPELAAVLLACANGTLDQAPALSIAPLCSACVIAAAQGYPGEIRKGDGLESTLQPSSDLQLFHAGTQRQADGRCITSGGRVLAVVAQADTFDNAFERAYTGLVTQFLPGGTHPMGGYRESIIRLVSNSKLLKNPNKLAGDSPQLPKTSPGGGSDTRNDFFVNASDSGGEGNDLFVYSQPGSYSANGGGGSDAYSISSYDVVVLIDGSSQAGRDTVVFDVDGTPSAQYYNTGSGPSNDIAVFSIRALDIPIALIGYTALSVLRQTTEPTCASIAARRTLALPWIFVATASKGKNSAEGTCFRAAAWKTRSEFFITFLTLSESLTSPM